PVVCPDLSPGPCKPTLKPALVISIDEKLLECLRREEEQPGKCFGQVTTDFDWPADASVAPIAEFGSRGATLLSSDRISVSDFLKQSVPVFESKGTTGVYIPEHCLVSEWVEGMVLPECQGAVGALQGAGFDLIKLPMKEPRGSEAEWLLTFIACPDL